MSTNHVVVTDSLVRSLSTSRYVSSDAPMEESELFIGGPSAHDVLKELSLVSSIHIFPSFSFRALARAARPATTK